ncbi:hypothetical protein [Streptacidiphilus melanogenes]|uniref:hypothetical protein n=1 Tax=Streptacidiphilus melanogenes TaxID=411235 RepID=UPI00126A36B9|nr:hypothetical protein [Streptacidiphilus melanogenes]
MTLWWSAALIAAGATVGVGLAGSALGAWREERSGRVYELTPRYLRVAARAVAAAVALVAAAVGGVMAAVGGPGAADRAAQAARAEQPVAAVESAADPSGASRSAAAHPDSDRAPKPAPAALAVVGRPSGGQLYLGTLPGVPGQVRVWLPPQYAAHRGAGTTALQAVVVRAPESELGEVWEGLAGAVTAGHANPFVAVAPADPCALAADDSALRGAVAGQFKVASRPRSWAEVGVDAASSCAVTAELAHPDAYAGAAALGGALPHPAPGKAASGASSPLPSGLRLLLAQAHRDTTGQAEANRLRVALQGAPDAAVRLSAVVRDSTPARERIRLVRMAADYVTEEFAAAAHR